ncbi:hypothetical protein C8Q74DRAFT_105814 [Fomes fomentarius]|nr:hypothetical protein C8Q74DRAFT_105814 [Fomes fomentarius]
MRASSLFYVVRHGLLVCQRLGARVVLGSTAVLRSCSLVLCFKLDCPPVCSAFSPPASRPWCALAW